MDHLIDRLSQMRVGSQSPHTSRPNSELVQEAARNPERPIPRPNSELIQEPVRSSELPGALSSSRSSERSRWNPYRIRENLAVPSSKESKEESKRSSWRIVLPRKNMPSSTSTDKKSKEKTSQESTEKLVQPREKLPPSSQDPISKQSSWSAARPRPNPPQTATSSTKRFSLAGLRSRPLSTAQGGETKRSSFASMRSRPKSTAISIPENEANSMSSNDMAAWGKLKKPKKSKRPELSQTTGDATGPSSEKEKGVVRDKRKSKRDSMFSFISSFSRNPLEMGASPAAEETTMVGALMPPASSHSAAPAPVLEQPSIRIIPDSPDLESNLETRGIIAELEAEDVVRHSIDTFSGIETPLETPQPNFFAGGDRDQDPFVADATALGYQQLITPDTTPRRVRNEIDMSVPEVPSSPTQGPSPMYLQPYRGVSSTSVSTFESGTSTLKDSVSPLPFLHSRTQAYNQRHSIATSTVPQSFITRIPNAINVNRHTITGVTDVSAAAPSSPLVLQQTLSQGQERQARLVQSWARAEERRRSLAWPNNPWRGGFGQPAAAFAPTFGGNFGGGAFGGGAGGRGSYYGGVGANGGVGPAYGGVRGGRAFNGSGYQSGRQGDRGIGYRNAAYGIQSPQRNSVASVASERQRNSGFPADGLTKGVREWLKKRTSVHKEV